MKLYHISEDSDIQEFNPRPIQNQNCGIIGDAVWAIDEDHLSNYLLPRDCPRLIYSVNNSTCKSDVEKFFKNSYATRIIAVESIWLRQIIEQCLFQYEFDDKSFVSIDDTAGYFISRKPIRPINKVIIQNPLLTICSMKHIEIRILPYLWRLREEVIQSSLSYSIIRMRNALEPPEGVERFHPLPK